MSSPRDHLASWLEDAYAMEQQAQTLLRVQQARLDNYPRLQDRMRQHLDETRMQQALVEGCLHRLGTSPSMIKDLAARVAAYGQVAGAMLADDEVVKGALACYVFEHVEISAYTALAAAAEAIGEPEIRDCCERILKQQADMAAWLEKHLPEFAVAFIERSAADRTDAKR